MVANSGGGGNVQTTIQDLVSQRAKNHTQCSQQSIQHSLWAIPQLLFLAEEQLIDIQRNLCIRVKWVTWKKGLISR